VKPSVRYLSDYLKKNQLDYVISSGPPHSMHLIALGLKKAHPGLKWIADFRDPWTNIDFYEKLMLSPAADRRHHRQELSVLKNADCVLSIGETMSEEFKAMYLNTGGADAAKFRVITNGFDEEDLPKQEEPKDAKFSLAHIGTLVKDRNPEVLWKVLAQLVKENHEFKKQLEIKLVGKVDVFIKERLEAHRLSSFVKKIDYLPHAEVIKEQQRSRILLLLVNNTKNAKGILTGKFFEYMASGTPVLAVGPVDGDLAGIIRDTNCGLISGFEDEAALKANLLAYFNGGFNNRNESAILKYSRKRLTKALCDILERLK